MSPPRVAIRPEEACRQLAWTLSYEREGELPVYIDGLSNALHRLRCKDARTPDRVARMAYTLDLHENKEVAVGLPRVAEFVYRSTVLWATSETKDSARRASRLTIPPDIVLKMGGSAKRLLLWVLKQPISAEAAEAANRRLAYALHSPQTHVRPERLRINLPGTFLRVGRSRPAPVLLTRLGDAAHTEAAVVGRLKSPPPPDQWRERRRG